MKKRLLQARNEPSKRRSPTLKKTRKMRETTKN
jgi:hypothetical protein